MKTTTKDIKELQEKLVQTCIDFINERGLEDVEEVAFNVDSLQVSAKIERWHPATDSTINVSGYEKDEHGLYKRYDIGSYC